MTQYQETEKRERYDDNMARLRYRFIKWGGFYAKFMSISIILELIGVGVVALIYIIYGVAWFANHIFI